jgi:hypothetical protein
MQQLQCNMLNNKISISISNNTKLYETKNIQVSYISVVRASSLYSVLLCKQRSGVCFRTDHIYGHLHNVHKL